MPRYYYVVVRFIIGCGYIDVHLYNLVAKTGGKRKRTYLSKKIRKFIIETTIKAIKKLESGEKWVWLPYSSIIVALEGKTNPYMWDALIFFQALGWEKAEIGSDKFLVLREHNKEIAKERVKSIIEAIQKKARSR